MDELAFYRQVAQAALGTDPDRVLEGVLDAAIALTGAARGAIVVGVAADPLLQVVRGTDERQPGLSQSVLSRVLADQVPLRLENALDEPEYKTQPSVRSLQLLSVLAVPLTLEGQPQPVGALYLDSSRVSGIFTLEHQEILERLGAQLAPQVARVGETLRLRERLRKLEADLQGPDGRLLGESPLVLELRDSIRRVAPSEAPVLVIGESGTGKELVARAIHACSSRKDGPFVTINCGALPAQLLESELFGHRTGAFTGAKSDRKGRLAAAAGGTLFLDEVGELSPPAQASLLRFLESGELQVVGADEPTTVSVRVVAATHRDLEQAVEAKAFRADLFYRLSVVPLTVPPLRARGADVELLSAHFLRRFARAEGREETELSPETTAVLAAHTWPGNVRELQNVLRRAILFGRDETIRPEDLPESVRQQPSPGEGSVVTARTKEELDAAKEQAADDLEREFALAALERAGGNVAQAARETGLHRSVLHRILKRIKEAN